MARPIPQTYLQTQIMTASPAQLRLMLLEGAVRFVQQGKQELEANQYESAFNALVRAQNIILELVNGLRPEVMPDLCEKLASLYVYIYSRIVTGCSERDPQSLEEALTLLQYERDTWAMTLQRLEEEQQEQRPQADQVATAAAARLLPEPVSSQPGEPAGGSLSLEV